MKHLLTFGLLLLAQYPLGPKGQGKHHASAPTIAYVQGCSNQSSGGAASASCTLSAPVTAGNMLYVCMTNFNSTTLAPVITGDTGSWSTEMPDTAWSSVGGAASFHSYCAWKAATGGGTSIAAANSGLNYPVINVDEYSGVTALDRSDAGASANSANPASGPITPTAAGLLVGYIAWDCCTNPNGGLTPSPSSLGPGYSAGSYTVNVSLQEFKANSVLASTSATFTLASSVNWFAHIAAFKP